MAIRSFATLLSVSSLLLNLTPVLAADTFTFIPTAASSTFPACGISCSLLQQAQSACIPPAVAVSNDDTTYVNCFCGSQYLLGLKTSGAVCSTCTSLSDQALLVQWYDGYCNGNWKTTTAAAATATSTSSTTSATNSAATSTSTAAPSNDGTTGSAAGSSNQSWFSTHWRWIVMLIVLIIGFTLLGVGGVWLKKRLDAKQPGLYHGDDRNNSSRPSRSPAAAAGFMIPSSLRNISSRNSMNNTAATTTPNNASTRNVNYQNMNATMDAHNYPTQQPNMSMTSLSNNRPEMWGPHQATTHTRGFDHITPVDDAAYGAGSDISSRSHNRRLSVNSAAGLHRGHEPVSPASPIQ
ncbi:hypothetical protein BGW36DRAFT_403971 [Talaromyces proteolyticus]|uniref:Integral membrane protein n=1 Tax=Talaromyces proteolyticus TaxID=1131652 RepID=A0AAD4L4W3_9EURO|nr:uncharacterized protein BGW36DRAFT_403971 [Talaromyces proteolyticus]KAH8703617.1 hypothetical protein BGW36DRAFT_403971 [Talaromyces proteolyticus]